MTEEIGGVKEERKDEEEEAEKLMVLYESQVFCINVLHILTQYGIVWRKGPGKPFYGG